MVGATALKIIKVKRCFEIVEATSRPPKRTAVTLVMKKEGKRKQNKNGSTTVRQHQHAGSPLKA